METSFRFINLDNYSIELKHNAHMRTHPHKHTHTSTHTHTHNTHKHTHKHTQTYAQTNTHTRLHVQVCGRDCMRTFESVSVRGRVCCVHVCICCVFLFVKVCVYVCV